MASKHMRYCIGLGQDSHKFLKDPNKPLVLGGVIIEGALGMDADSDGDVCLHALCNAITSVTHVPIMGKVAIEMCHIDQIKDSSQYLFKALETLQDLEIEHISFSLEGSYPKLQRHIDTIRASIAKLTNLSIEQVGMSVISGNGLTSFGQGQGLMCQCIITVKKGENNVR